MLITNKEGRAIPFGTGCMSYEEQKSYRQTLCSATCIITVRSALPHHTWPEDDIHILAVLTGGPLRLSGQVEKWYDQPIPAEITSSQTSPRMVLGVRNSDRHAGKKGVFSSVKNQHHRKEQKAFVNGLLLLSGLAREKIQRRC